MKTSELTLILMGISALKLLLLRLRLGELRVLHGYRQKVQPTTHSSNDITPKKWPQRFECFTIGESSTERINSPENSFD